jgi:PAS domain S-box-containing protein
VLFRSLADVSAALSKNALDLKGLARAVYEQTTRLIPRCEVFYLAWYDDRTHEIRFVLAMEKGQEKPAAPRTLTDDPATWGLSGWIIRRPTPLLINDLAVEQLPCPSFTFGNPDRLARSYLGLPLMVGGQVVGVISVQCYEPHAIIVDDQRFLEAVASQAAVALANAIAHERQRAAQELTRSLLDNAPDGIMAVDSHGYAKLFSAGAERILGYTQAEAIGGPLHVAKLWGGNEKAKAFNDRLAQQGRIENEKVQTHSKDGKPLSLLLSAAVLEGPRQDGIRSIGFFKDIVALQALQDELSARLEAIERLAAAQDIDEGLRDLAEALLRAADAAVCCVLTRDSNTGRWSVRATYTTAGPSTGGAQHISSSFMDGMAAWADVRVYGPDDEELGHNVVQHFQQRSGVGLPLGAVIVLPLRPGRETFGLCILGLRQARSECLSDSVVRVARAIAAPAARMIERIRRQEATELRLGYSQRLRGAVQAVSACATAMPQDVTRAVAQAACDVIGADLAVLYPYVPDPLAFDVRNVGAHGLHNAGKRWSTKPRQESMGLATTVLQRAEPLIVDDVNTGWDRGHQVAVYPAQNLFLQREAVRAFAGFPLRAGELAVGSLFVSFRSTHLFGQDELDALELLAQQATVSLGQARLSLRAEKAHRMIEASRDITGVLGTTVETQPIWKAILQGALQVTGAGRGCILLTDPMDRRLKAATQRGFNAARRSHLKALAAGDCLPLAECMQSGQPCLIADLDEDPRGQECCGVCPGTRSLLAAPIGRPGQTPGVGVIVVESNKRAAFGDDDKELLQRLGEYGAVALESAGRYAHARRDARVFEGLLRTGPAIAALEPLDKALQAIADRVRDIFKCDVVMLYPYEQEHNRIGFPPVHSGHLRRPERVVALDYVDSASVVGQLLRRRSAYFAKTPASDPLFSNSDFVPREGIESTAGVPLLMGRERVGILFANYRQPHPFPRDEQAAIRLFASQAAVTIHNARQFEAALRDSIHRQALYEAAAAITGSLAGDQRSVLAAIVKAAVDVASAHGQKATLGVLQMRDTERNALSFESVYPPEKEDTLRQRHGPWRSLDKSQAPGARIGISGRAALSGQTQRADHVAMDPDYVIFDEATVSELDVPLKDDGEVIGVLGVESPARDAFSEHDAATLENLAAMAVTALKVSRQTRRLRRTNTVAVMGTWSADVRHVIQRQVRRIRWAVHEALKNPNLSPPVVAELQKIDSYADNLRGTDIPTETPEPGQALAGFDPPEVDRVVTSVVDELLGAYADVSLAGELGCTGLRVAMHEEWLSNVLRELIGNAAKAIQSTPRQGKVWVRSRPKDRQVYIEVEDTGPGLPPSLERIVLEEPIPKADGHVSRGLLLVRFLVEQYGGQVRLERNHPGQGACFSFTLPVAETAPPHDARR